MKKLISMTDFVLEVLNEDRPCDRGKMLDEIGNYARFLKQPLTLGMFVPYDDKFGVMELPSGAYSSPNNYKMKLGCYETAKEKVLFDGFEIIQGQGTANLTKFLVYKKEDIGFKKEWKEDWEFEYKFIDSLSELDLLLTESAIKQIGL